MSINKKMLEASAGWIASQGAVAPEGVDFDGTNDYLSRSSDLTGNADGKTFTFSCWVYRSQTNESVIYYVGSGTVSAGSGGLSIFVDTSGNLDIGAYNTSNVVILNITDQSVKIPLLTWTHVLVSVDLAGSAHVYINDSASTPTIATYTNENIHFTQVAHRVGRRYDSDALSFKGRLAHVYLDYTYRDLSNSANRRLFIDADLKPAANQASLSPILYLPMTDADTAHVNSGTGGDFSANGTFATSQRGPNQDNCVASEFATTADYLSKASITGLSTSKQCVFSFNFKPIEANVDHQIVMIGSTYNSVQYSGIFGKLVFYGRNTAGTYVVNMETTNTFPLNQNLFVQVSYDTSSASNRHVFVNGVEQPLTVTTYTIDGIIDPTASTSTISETSGLYQKVVGEVYYDQTYIDLSTNNPFWDADNNRPKPVRQVLEETGNTPLIAMPIEASNAGLNLGTGGNFTVNSGPYTGARGGSEFWARSADFDGTTGYLSNASFNATSVNTLTVAVSFKVPDTTTTVRKIFQLGNNGLYAYTSGTSFYVNANNSGASPTYLAASVSGILANTWHTVLLSVDLSNSSLRTLLIDDAGTPTWTTYTDGNIPYASTSMNIGRAASAAQYFSDNIANLYLSSEYFDFTSEANRLKFVDAFNYPIDLQPAIDAGDIPNPLVYMKFDDPLALGTNSGTGGNFTVNGTVTAGADVQP